MADKPATFADWEKLAAGELKADSAASLSRDYGGLPVKPAYFAEDVPDEAASALPGVVPFTRGIRATMYANRPWTIRQYAGFSTARESNAFFRQALELAFTLADGKEYVKTAISKGLQVDDFAGRLSFFWAIGMNFYLEVA
ncbi:MAG TPA: methylmalonyl-CoA mutase family protein, partial [Devosiaceae bacterium]|nr:methylmalonyl-CoA mutase family protein [Devosiaceae bacterium]